MYMFNKKYQQNELNTLSVMVFFYKWRKSFISVGIIAAVTSFVACLIVQPKFKSTVVLFPSTNTSIAKALLSENPGAKQDIGQFGEEEEAEQLLQILNSDDIRSRIIEKYNLLDHYKIPENSKYRMSELLDEFEDNITFKRTEFLSVKITVYDANPQMAANIANDIAALSDSIHNKVVKQRSGKALKLIEGTYLSLKNDIKHDEDSLNWLRAQGVNDYESQSERITEGLSKAILEGKSKAIQEFKAQLDVLSKYGGAYVSLRDNLEFKRKQLSFIKSKYEEAKLDVDQDLPYKFVVNKAMIAEKKSFPITWLVVLITIISSEALLSFFILTRENYLKLRK